jgi:hypothetical protein
MIDEATGQTGHLVKGDHPRDRIRAALALFDEGGSSIRDGGGDSGPPLYDSSDQGWLLQMECGFNERSTPGATGQKLLVYRFYVDHVGGGRREALRMYLDALRAAALAAEVAPIHAGSAKQVVWLAGSYDGDGRRLD